LLPVRMTAVEYRYRTFEVVNDSSHVIHVIFSEDDRRSVLLGTVSHINTFEPIPKSVVYDGHHLRHPLIVRNGVYHDPTGCIQVREVPLVRWP